MWSAEKLRKMSDPKNILNLKFMFKNGIQNFGPKQCLHTILTRSRTLPNIFPSISRNLTHSRHLSKPSRHLPNIFLMISRNMPYTHSRHVLDTFQIPPIYLQEDTFVTPSKPSKAASHKFGVAHRVVGGLQVHNHITLWPNLQVGTCKNSSQVEFQAGPEYSNTALLKYCIVTILY